MPLYGLTVTHEKMEQKYLDIIGATQMAIFRITGPQKETLTHIQEKLEQRQIIQMSNLLIVQQIIPFKRTIIPIPIGQETIQICLLITAI